MTKTKLFVAILGVSMLLAPCFVSAQTGRSYSYDAIVQHYTVNKDSTVDVVEAQTYNYVGAYHSGWRSIALKGVGSIDDITLSDGATGNPFTYTSSRLDKTNPASWGKYTYYIESGHENIEWYYDLADTSHAFVLGYRLHGAVGFYSDHDELYWNLATEYTVPITHIEATVVIPKDVSSGDLHGFLYVDTDQKTPVSAKDTRSIFFALDNVAPDQQVTIAAAWPKGLVSQGSYYADLLSALWGWSLGLFVVFLAIGWAVYYQKISVRHEGRGTIIPQYEPPMQLPPAEAELLVKESVSSKAWPATVIDLAVRGYLTVAEDTQKSINWNSLAPLIVRCFGIGLIIIIAGPAIFDFTGMLASPKQHLFSGVFLAFLILALVKVDWKGAFTTTEYILHKTEKDRTGLKPYELKFVEMLFGGSDSFSTRALKKDQSKMQALAAGFPELLKILDKEAETETGGYSNTFESWTKFSSRAGIGMIALFYLSLKTDLFRVVFSGQPGVFTVLLIVAACIVGYGYFNPRLNQKGELLKEDWLGFKMYLETAERYRMQNLTPDLFEKYLPYAMIFGIEKKWAKAFNGLNMESPGWYQGGGVTSSGSSFGSSSGGVASFSAGAFAAGFSTSFATSFASSGGGGGSAGGGGGGGGGGGAG